MQILGAEGLIVLRRKGVRVADAWRTSSNRVIRGMFASRSEGVEVGRREGSRIEAGMEVEEMKMVGRPALMMVTGKEELR